MRSRCLRAGTSKSSAGRSNHRHDQGKQGCFRQREGENRGETGTVHCRGRNVSVSGKRNQITLQGDCPFIEVSGDENELQIESVGEISLSGDDNRLSWQRSSRGSAPAVGDDGDGNRVERSAD